MQQITSPPPLPHQRQQVLDVQSFCAGTERARHEGAGVAARRLAAVPLDHARHRGLGPRRRGVALREVLRSHLAATPIPPACERCQFRTASPSCTQRCSNDGGGAGAGMRGALHVAHFKSGRAHVRRDGGTRGARLGRSVENCPLPAYRNLAGFDFTPNVANEALVRKLHRSE